MEQLAETQELLTFVEVVESESLSKAAKALKVPRVTVGRRLQRLEQNLGVRLLRRTTRRVALTDAGKELYPNARAVVDAVREAAASVRRRSTEVTGTLRIATPPSAPALAALFAEFLNNNPGVRLEVRGTTEFVDFLSSGIDVAFRASMTPTPGTISRTLARSELLAVASPAYLEKHGVPQRASELASHRCVLGFERGLVPNAYWPLRKGGRVKVDGSLACNDITLLMQAAISGQGIALLPDMLVREAIEHGLLNVVLGEVIGASSTFALVYLERELMPKVLRAFIDHTLAYVEAGRLVMGRPACPESAGKTKRVGRRKVP